MQTPDIAGEEASEQLPSLSEASFGDLTSLLVKTGRAVEAGGHCELEQARKSSICNLHVESFQFPFRFEWKCIVVNRR